MARGKHTASRRPRLAKATASRIQLRQPLAEQTNVDLDEVFNYALYAAQTKREDGDDSSVHNLSVQSSSDAASATPHADAPQEDEMFSTVGLEDGMTDDCTLLATEPETYSTSNIATSPSGPQENNAYNPASPNTGSMQGGGADIGPNVAEDSMSSGSGSTAEAGQHVQHGNEIIFLHTVMDKASDKSSTASFNAHIKGQMPSSVGPVRTKVFRHSVWPSGFVRRTERYSPTNTESEQSDPSSGSSSLLFVLGQTSTRKAVTRHDKHDCPFCDKPSSRSDSLQRHLQRCTFLKERGVELKDTHAVYALLMEKGRLELARDGYFGTKEGSLGDRLRHVATAMGQQADGQNAAFRAATEAEVESKLE